VTVNAPRDVVLEGVPPLPVGVPPELAGWPPFCPPVAAEGESSDDEHPNAPEMRNAKLGTTAKTRDWSRSIGTFCWASGRNLMGVGETISNARVPRPFTDS
jgi:hypothetical protein